MKAQTQPTYTHEFVSSYVSDNASLRALNAELLAALKRASGSLDEKFGEYNRLVENKEGRVTPMLQLIKDCQAAIAKAERHET